MATLATIVVGALVPVTVPVHEKRGRKRIAAATRLAGMNIRLKTRDNE